MKYNYIVKSGGVYYAAGEDVPEGETRAEATERETKVEPDKTEMEIDELPFSDSDIQMETEPARRGRPRKSDM